MKQRILVICAATMLLLGSSAIAGAWLHAQPKAGRDFSDEILFNARPGTTEQQLQWIVTAMRGTQLRKTALPGNVWVFDVVWAKSENDTQRVVRQLKSYQEIQSAEINGLGSLDQ